MKSIRIVTAAFVLGIGAKTAGAQAPTPGGAPTPPLNLTRLGEVEPSKALWAIRGTSRMYYFAREEYRAEGWMLTQPLAFFFNPDKFALRAGWAYGNQWDDANVGNYSLATGYNTMARGWYSTALGAATSAEKDHCTAMGYSSKASGFCSTAVGKSTVAAGDYAIAMGYYSEASGEHALSLGAGTTASGDHAVALGDYTTAAGASATAAGRASKATGDYAVAVGYGVSAQDTGTVALGTWVTARAPNAMVIGAGRNSNELMVNSIPNSLAVGFNTERPILTVSENGVGIGVDAPDRSLHVRDTLRLEPREEAPGRPQEGDLYYSKIDHTLKCFDGTAWRNCF